MHSARITHSFIDTVHAPFIHSLTQCMHHSFICTVHASLITWSASIPILGLYTFILT